MLSGLVAMLSFAIFSISLRGNLRLGVAAIISVTFGGSSLVGSVLRRRMIYRPRRIMHQDAWRVILYVLLAFIVRRTAGMYAEVDRNPTLAFTIEQLPEVQAVLSSDFGTPEDGYKLVSEWLNIATARGGNVTWGVGEQRLSQIAVEAVVKKANLPPLVLRWGLFTRRKKPWFIQMDFGGRTVRNKGEVIRQLQTFQFLVEWPAPADR